MVLGPARLAYSVWIALAFLGVGVATLVLLAALPGVTRRRAAAARLARAFFLLAGMPLRVKSLERLPPGQCVVVCNHASYLDGIVLTAALPARFGFVIKREMAGVPLAGVLLRRLGSEFVERFDRQRGATDARRVLRNASNGQSLVFFPEGTFTRTPGLLKFHTGAFLTAARVGCPVVPAVVRGTRRALPPSGALPSPGRIELEILTALTSAADAPELAAPELRDRARTAILAVLGEPDLTCCADTARPPDRARAKSARAS
jgi:1-acyl-sn-glycerol-3-phosphate acyltransferase